MLRRSVLTGTGIAITSLSGCINGTSDDGHNSTPEDWTSEDTPIETVPQRLAIGKVAEFADGTSITVTNPIVQESIIADHSTFLTVELNDGIQFVVIDVDGDADFEPSSFVLERNGAVVEPPQTQQFIRSVIRDCDGTCIGVPVNAEPVDSAAIAYRSDDDLRAVWDLDDATITAISKPPNLLLHDASITNHGGDAGIQLTVENSGDRDGMFLALIAPAWVADVEDPVGFSVPAGVTVTEIVSSSEIRQIDPGAAAIAEEPSEDTRRIVIEENS